MYTLGNIHDILKHATQEVHRSWKKTTYEIITFSHAEMLLFPSASRVESTTMLTDGRTAAHGTIIRNPSKVKCNNQL